MNVAVICEFSGIVREAFRRRGHTAISYDLLPTEIEGPHVIGDVRDADLSWADLVIAHPSCRRLAVSGARWFKDFPEEQEEALEFVRWILALKNERIALENPVSVISSRIRKPDQIIQPFHFGDPFRKTTCLWLKNLPKLEPTNDLGTGYPQCHREPPGPERWKRRSRTYPGFADAMAAQWGALEVVEQAA